MTTRDDVLALVAALPGVHVRELAREAKLSEALAGYHVSKLLQAGLIISEDDGHFLRLYPTHGRRPTPQQRAMLVCLRKPAPLRIVLLLLDNSPRQQLELAEVLGLAKSTVSAHVSALAEAGLVKVGTEGTSILNAGRVRRLLATWGPSSSMEDRFESTIGQLYQRQASIPKAGRGTIADATST